MPSRYEPNPAFFREMAASDEIRNLVLGAAQRGANVARALAPSYSGPTYNPAIVRSGQYRTSIYSSSHQVPSGWRGEFGAEAPWALQVEFGTGGGRTGRDSHGRFRRISPRPQGGYSPKARVLGRALDAIREP